MATITLPYNFTPRDYQLDSLQAFDSGKYKRFYLLHHRRCGKDLLCWNIVVKEAASTVGNYYYSFPLIVQGRRALWEGKTKDGIPYLSMVPKALIASRNNQEMKLELTNGSIIRIIGTDDIDSIRGAGFKGLVASELAWQRADMMSVLVPILEESEGWFIGNTTPAGRNHAYDLWETAREDPEWYCDLKQTYWPDREGYTGMVPPDRMEKLKRYESEEYLQQEFGCSFTAVVGGAIFQKWVEEAYDQERVYDFPIPSNKAIDTFWDLGIGDSLSIWFRIIDKDWVKWVDYKEWQGASFSTIIADLKELGYNYRTFYLPHDGNNRIQGKTEKIQTQAEILEELLIENKLSDDVVVLPKVNRKQDSIQACRSRMNNYKWHATNCEEGLKKLSLYHYKYDPKLRRFLDTPAKDGNDHCADAFQQEAIAENIGWDRDIDVPITVNNTTEVWI